MDVMCYMFYTIIFSLTSNEKLSSHFLFIATFLSGNDGKKVRM